MFDYETICLKIYRVNREVLVAICDRELLGNTFDEGKLCLEVNVDFFGDKSTSSFELETALSEATIVNLVGERSVACAIQQGCVDGDNVLHIDGVPYAQMVRM